VYVYPFLIKTDISKIDSVHVELYLKGSGFTRVLKNERFKLNIFENPYYSGQMFNFNGELNTNYDYIIGLNVSTNYCYKFKLSELKIESMPGKFKCECTLHTYRLNGISYSINEGLSHIDPIKLVNPIVEERATVQSEY